MGVRKAGRHLSLFEAPRKQAPSGGFKCISLTWAGVGSGRGREGGRRRRAEEGVALCRTGPAGEAPLSQRAVTGRWAGPPVLPRPPPVLPTPPGFRLPCPETHLSPLDGHVLLRALQPLGGDQSMPTPFVLTCSVALRGSPSVLTATSTGGPRPTCLGLAQSGKHFFMHFSSNHLVQATVAAPFPTLALISNR